MAEDRRNAERVPLVIDAPGKPVSEMTDEERWAFARELFDKMKATRKPVEPT